MGKRNRDGKINRVSEREREIIDRERKRDTERVRRRPQLYILRRIKLKANCLCGLLCKISSR